MPSVKTSHREIPWKVKHYLEAGGADNVRGLWAEVEGDTYSVLVSRDRINRPTDMPDCRWHISVAGQTDVPPWRVMAAIAHAVRPGVPFVMAVPPRSWWINVHEHCLHMWEVQDGNLLNMWRAERRADTPT